jgi:hypothetical protein
MYCCTGPCTRPCLRCTLRYCNTDRGMGGHWARRHKLEITGLRNGGWTRRIRVGSMLEQSTNAMTATKTLSESRIPRKRKSQCCGRWGMTLTIRWPSQDGAPGLIALFSAPTGNNGPGNSMLLPGPPTPIYGGVCGWKPNPAPSALGLYHFPRSRCRAHQHVFMAESGRPGPCPACPGLAPLPRCRAHHHMCMADSVGGSATLPLPQPCTTCPDPNSAPPVS